MTSFHGFVQDLQSQQLLFIQNNETSSTSHLHLLFLKMRVHGEKSTLKVFCLVQYLFNNVAKKNQNQKYFGKKGGFIIRYFGVLLAFVKITEKKKQLLFSPLLNLKSTEETLDLNSSKIIIPVSTSWQKYPPPFPLSPSISKEKHITSFIAKQYLSFQKFQTK